MTVLPREHSEPLGHLVYLYGEEDRALIRSVTRYLVEGLQRGDALMVVASPKHSATLLSSLRDESGYARSVLEGRVAWLDAEETLSGILVNGEPHWSRFLTVVGDVIRELQERGRGHPGVRAYSEIVGRLWGEGQHSWAARLEDYWNRLREVTGCSLYCAYPVDVFSPDFSADKIGIIVNAHTHVITQSDHLEAALARALDDVLGARFEDLRKVHVFQPSRLPRAEGLVLWIRRHFRDQADEILARARDHYFAATV